MYSQVEDEVYQEEEAEIQLSDENPEAKKAAMKEKLVEELNLTAEQQEEWEDINQKYKPEYQALKEEAKASRERDKDKYKAVRQEHDAEIEEILTPEQIEKWNEMKKNGKKHMKKRMHERRGRG